MSDLIKHYRQLVGIAKTWAMKNLPGWSDDSHRDLLTLHGAVMIDGRISASSLNMPQLNAVLGDYERRGWSRTKRVFNGAGAGQSKKVPEQIGFIVKLWGKIGAAGKVQNDSRQALLAWCGRQVKRDVPNLDALSVAERQAAIEALKGWLARDASRLSLTPPLSSKRAREQM